MTPLLVTAAMLAAVASRALWLRGEGLHRVGDAHRAAGRPLEAFVAHDAGLASQLYAVLATAAAGTATVVLVVGAVT
ncbi:MAG: hypothetical protein R2695_04015 [Acidimicrobiales bacterium]